MSNLKNPAATNGISSSFTRDAMIVAFALALWQLDPPNKTYLASALAAGLTRASSWIRRTPGHQANERRSIDTGMATVLSHGRLYDTWNGWDSFSYIERAGIRVVIWTRTWYSYGDTWTTKMAPKNDTPGRGPGWKIWNDKSFQKGGGFNWQYSAALGTRGKLETSYDNMAAGEESMCDNVRRLVYASIGLLLWRSVIIPLYLQYFSVIVPRRSSNTKFSRNSWGISWDGGRISAIFPEIRIEVILWYGAAVSVYNIRHANRQESLGSLAVQMFGAVYLASDFRKGGPDKNVGSYIL